MKIFGLICDYCEKQIDKNDIAIEHKIYENGEQIKVWLHEYCFKKKHIKPLITKGE